MLNYDNGLQSAGSNKVIDLDKRVKNLETTVGSFNTRINSEAANFNDLDVVNANISKINATSIESDLITAKNANITSFNGTTAIVDNIVTKSMKIVSDEGVKAEIDNADIKIANIEDARIKNLTLENRYFIDATIDDLISKTFSSNNVKISNKEALREQIFNELSVGDGFNNLNLKSTQRPKWESNELALKSDVTGLTFRGVVEAQNNLPNSANNGDLYWIKENTSVAIYTDKWNITAFPVLNAYRTSTDQDLIDNNLQNQINNNKQATDAATQKVANDLSTLDGVVTANKTTADEQHAALDGKITTNTESINAVDEKVKVIESRYLSDAPSDDNIYGRKNGEWLNINDNTAFVPRIHKKENVDFNTIESNDTGINLTSKGTITVDTPASNKNATTKQIINQEYLRNNLKLKKNTVASATEVAYKTRPMIDRTLYHYVTLGEQKMWPAQATMMMDNTDLGTATYFNGNGSFTRTKDYLINVLTASRYDAAAGQMNSVVHLVDSTGTVKDISVERSGNAYHRASGQIDYLVFTWHPDVWNEDNQNEWFIWYKSCDFINMYDGPVWKKKIEIPELYDKFFGDQCQYVKLTETGNINICSLRGSEMILLAKNGNNKSIILYRDNDKDIRFKEVTLLNKNQYGTLSAGKKNFWLFSGDHTQRANIQAITPVVQDDNTLDSPVQSYIIQREGQTCDQLETYTAYRAFKELENGDVIYALNTKYAGAETFTTGFAYCYDNTESSNKVEYIPTTNLFIDASNDRLLSAADYPFVETRDYIYFFYSYPQVYYPTANETFSPLTTSYGMSKVENKDVYIQINKTTKAITYSNLPWVTKDGATTPRTCRHFKTKGGYTWVWPLCNTEQSKVLVISPEGQTQTVDLGTGSNKRWGVAFWATYVRSDLISDSWTGNIVVNSDGYGIAIAQDLTAICIFYGNGEYAIYEYAEPFTTFDAETRKKESLCYAYPTTGSTLSSTVKTIDNYSSPVFSCGKSCIIRIDPSDIDTYVTQVIITPNGLDRPKVSHQFIGFAGDSYFSPFDWLPQFTDFDYATRNKYNTQNVRMTTMRGIGSGMYVTETTSSGHDEIVLSDNEYVISEV